MMDPPIEFEVDSCVLCGSSDPLQNSHVLPAFVFRWLRKTSGTGHFRNTNNPNVRVQDGIKLPLLCAGCEAAFSSYEAPFASDVFHRFQDDSAARMRYGPWLLRFCTSVSWRVLVYAKLSKHLNQLNQEQIQSADFALQRWKSFLQGNSPHPGPYEQHLLPMAAIESHNIEGLSTSAKRYLMRAIHMDVVVAESMAFTFAKLGPIMVFGFIKPPARRWKGTKVHVRSGEIRPSTYELPRELFSYLMDKANAVADSQRTITENQFEKMESALRSNPERFAESQQMKAMMLDAQLFGLDAIIRQKKG